MLTKPCQEVALVIGTATEEAIAVDIPIEVMYKVVRMPSWRVCSPESGLKQHIEEGDASSNQDGSQIEEGEVDNPNGRSDRHCDQN